MKSKRAMKIKCEKTDLIERITQEIPVGLVLRDIKPHLSTIEWPYAENRAAIKRKTKEEKEDPYLSVHLPLIMLSQKLHIYLEQMIFLFLFPNKITIRYIFLSESKTDE